MSKRETKKYDANIVLYNMCKDDEGKIDDIFSERLAGKIWLIGRSYAASPERRHYTFYKNNKKITKPEGLELKTSNADGTSGFFDAIAERVNESQKKKINDLFNDLKNASYTKDDKDKEILEKVVELIYCFNQTLVSTIEEIDEKDTKIGKYKGKNITAKCNNFISFCSKFMHFHLPKVVFIYDSYSYAGGKKWIKANSKESISLFDKKEVDNDMIATMSSYIEHICNAYSAYCSLCEENKLSVNEENPTRIVDNFLLEQNKI